VSDKDLAFIDWILVVLVLSLALGSLVLATRRIAIRRPGGAVRCSLRRDSALRWQRGVVAYRTGQLLWFRSMRVRMRPDAAFDRGAMRLAERSEPELGNAVVRFDTGTPGETLWLQLSPDALTGLMAWLEAAPLQWLGEGALDLP
jgi:hypothetical protein